MSLALDALGQKEDDAKGVDEQIILQGMLFFLPL